MVERVDKLIRPSQWKAAYEQINAFERQLTDDGAVVVKFFLHIDQRTQAKRFKKIRRSPAEAWKVTEDDLRHHRKYDKFAQAIDEMLQRTDAPAAKWHIVPATDLHHAVIQTYRVVIAAWQKALRAAAAAKRAAAGAHAAGTASFVPVKTNVLDGADLSLRLDRPEYEQQLAQAHRRLRELEHLCYAHRVGVVVTFEGCDAAGKGGCIRRLTSRLDPRGFEVVPIGAPNDEERTHQYLWRFWRRMPKAGHITIFDRTWYGRVLVERVEGFAPAARWQRAYDEINQFEDAPGRTSGRCW